MNWYIDVLKKYTVFSGRARRKEYWFFVLFNTMVFLLMSVIDALIGTYDPITEIGILASIYSLGVFLPSMAVTVRRLHDTDRNGWWILLPILAVIIGVILITIIIPTVDNTGSSATSGIIIVVGLLMLASYIMLFVFMVLDSTPGTNNYGANPKNMPEPDFNDAGVQKTTLNVHENHKINPNIASITLRGIGSGTSPIVLSENMEVLVGRSTHVNVNIDNKYVSSKHLSLILINGKVKVRDMASSNGTYIDGKKLDSNISYVLNQGERLLIGSEDVIYTL